MGVNQWHTPTSAGPHVPAMQPGCSQDFFSSRLLQTLTQMEANQAAINSRLTSLETTASRLSNLEETLTAGNPVPIASTRGRGRGRGRGRRQVTRSRRASNLPDFDDEDEDEVDPTLIDLGRPTGTLLPEARSVKSTLKVRESTVSMVIVLLTIIIRGPSVKSIVSFATLQ